MTDVLITGDLTVNGTVNVNAKCAFISDQKSSGTSAGTASTGYADRTLNTLEDPYGLITLDAGNVLFSFNETGRYYIQAMVPSYATDRHRATLNLSDNTLITVGTGSYARSGGVKTCTNFSRVEYILTVTSTSDQYKIRQYHQTSRTSTGLGFACSTGSNEIYSSVLIIKLSD